MGDFDDKGMVVVAATLLALFSMFTMPESQTVVSNVVTGLFGIAVGKTMKGEVK